MAKKPLSIANKIILIFCVIITLLTVTIVGLRNYVQMDIPSMFTISVDIEGMLIETILIFVMLLDKQDGSRSNRVFHSIGILLICMLFIDIMCLVVDGRFLVTEGIFTENTLKSINMIMNSAYYIGAAILPVLFWKYILLEFSTFSKAVVIIDKVIKFACVAHIIVVFINIFTECWFYVDPITLEYAKNDPYQIFSLLVPFGIAIETALLVTVQKNVPVRQKLIVAVFCILPVAVAAVESAYMGLTSIFAMAVCSTIILYGLIYVRRGQKIEQKETELELSKSALLMGQIKPHFINNCLGVIRSLIADNPETAEDAIDRFSSYLQDSMLIMEKEENIPFRQELNLMENFLFLEKLRFGSKLNIVENYEITDFQIPPLTVQPIVENAIRHGLMKKLGGGTVSISTAQEGSNIIITVIDDGIGFDVDSLSNIGEVHVGIRNVASRLHLMIGGTLDIYSNKEEGGTTVIITVPVVSQ